MQSIHSFVSLMWLLSHLDTAARRKPLHDTPEMTDILINANTLQFVKDKT